VGEEMVEGVKGGKAGGRGREGPGASSTISRTGSRIAKNGVAAAVMHSARRHLWPLLSRMGAAMAAKAAKWRMVKAAGASQAESSGIEMRRHGMWRQHSHGENGGVASGVWRRLLPIFVNKHA